MKTCSKCKLEKPLEDFPKKGFVKGKQVYRSDCKDCKSELDKKVYANTDLERRRILQAEATKRRLANNRKLVYDYLKNHPCVDCGQDNIIVLEFDHVRGEKTQSISTMVARHRPESEILEEIEKCDVRCANCHRIVTAQRGGWNVLDHLD
jgi:hypothetical protein